MVARILMNAHDRLAKQIKFVLTAKAALNATALMVLQEIMLRRSVKT